MKEGFMSKLLVIFALVVGIAMFTLVNTEEVSAMNKAELVDAISSDAGLSKADAKGSVRTQGSLSD
jgi:hypothetical protein